MPREKALSLIKLYSKYRLYDDRIYDALQQLITNLIKPKGKEDQVKITMGIQKNSV